MHEKSHCVRDGVSATGTVASLGSEGESGSAGRSVPRADPRGKE